MSVKLSTDPTTKTAEILVNGRVSRQDFDRLVPDFEAFIEKCGTIRLLEVITRLDGFDPTMIWDGMKLDIRVIPHISHCAVVSDIGWISPISKAAGAVMNTKMRTFPLAEVELARAWLADFDS